MIQLGEKAPARLLPFLNKIQLEAPGDEAPQPLLKVTEDMEYPASMLQTAAPIKYRVKSSISLAQLSPCPITRKR